MDEAVSVSNDAPVLIDKFLDRAIELDVDCICDGKEVYIGGIMQHIEEAGVHSGDSACSLPPVSISDELIKELEEKTKAMALGLGVVGLMNTQYAIHKGDIYLIEVNPRASRTVPFVSKATGMPLAKVATRVMWGGESLRNALDTYNADLIWEDNGVLKPILKDHISVKEAVFPFNKLSGSDPILTPEMKSTGEVMGISSNFGESYAKAQSAAKNDLPTSGKVFISLCDLDKEFAPKIAQGLVEEGFSVVATGGTHKAISDAGIECEKVLKISEGRPNITDSITNGEIALAFNTSDGKESSKSDGQNIRRAVLKENVPYVTTAAAALACVEAMKALRRKDGVGVKSIQDFLND